MKLKQPTLEDLGISQTEYDFICSVQTNILERYTKGDVLNQKDADEAALALFAICGAPTGFKDKRIYHMMALLFITELIFRRLRDTYACSLDAAEVQNVRIQCDRMQHEVFEVLALFRKTETNKNVTKLNKFMSQAIEHNDYDGTIYGFSAVFGTLKLAMIVNLKEHGLVAKNVTFVDAKMKKFIDDTRNMKWEEISLN